MSHSLRSWRLLVGTLLGLVCLWLVARDVSWLEVGRALRAADYRLLALAAVLVVAATGIRAWCWRRIYGPTPRPTTFIRAWRILLVAQFLNIGVPARVGDVARVYLIGEAGQFSKTAAATSLVIEKFFDMIALLLMLFLIATQTDLPPTLDEAAFGLAVATVALALVVVALAWKSDRLVPSEFGPVLASLHKSRDQSKLSSAALETLAIVAYKQPALRAEIEAIRGVSCGEMLRSLMERHLVKIVGRAEEIGRPMLYGTTKSFLEVFGLVSLKDLPKVRELRQGSDGQTE